MNFKDISFKTKLILVISIINVAIVSLTLWVRTKQIETSFKERMVFRTQVIVNIIAYSIDDETKLNRDVVAKYSDFIIQEPEIQYVGFYNKRDELINIAGNFKKEKLTFKTENIFNITDNVYDVYREMKNSKGEKIGSIIVGFPMQSLVEMVHENVITGVIIWVGAIVLILVLNNIFIAIFLKPIRDIHRAAVYMSEKDFSHKIPIGSGDELGQISKQFNIMTEELKSFYGELERKVKEATNELQEANKRLKEMDEKKSEFVAIVAHDLRTPITSIIGFADTIMNKELKLTEQDKEEYLNIIRLESRRLARLIADFLDISKIEDNRLNMDIKKTKIKELIDKTLNSIGTNSKGVALSLESEANLPEVYLDADRITQVLQNLIVNALKYSPQNSVIKVLLKQNPSEMQISVIDQGPGIPDKDREKVFEKFYRGNDDISKHERGSGLGLAISKSIIEMHGGRIWVVDAAPSGSGSCFIFTLPIKD